VTRGKRPPLPAQARVWLFSALLALAGLALAVVFLRGVEGPIPPVPIPWPVIALAFFAAELRSVDVHFRRERHSFTLSEVAAVVGFFVLPPSQYFAALFVGTGTALLVNRQGPLKLAFNLANAAFTASAALTVLYAIHPPSGPPDPVAWLAAFAATFTAAVLSAVAVSTAITVSGGAPQFEKLPEMIQFGGLVAVANTSLALLAVALLWQDPRLLVLLAVPVAAVFLAYRAYISEREKHQRLELLYQSSRILQHSPELDSALGALLEHVREVFRAEWAEVLLWPREDGGEALRTTARHDGPTETMTTVPMGQAHPLHGRVGAEGKPFLHLSPIRQHRVTRQAMAVPLVGESGTFGSMVIANRLTEGTTFSHDDLRLLETLANQAAVALENGQLEQSLRELSRLKEELRYQAYHDPLTGLANRTLFSDRVDDALASGGDLVPVVLFVDLDNFKDVNDTLGHSAGDGLLRAVAERVRTCIRVDDLAARLGGDEFAILLFDDERLGTALSVAARLIEALAVTFQVDGQELRISGSVGIAASLGGAERAGDLLRNADVAMYTAKQAGKNRFSVFQPDMYAAIVARHQLSTELSRGILEGEIDVFYQPIVALADGGLYGAEALARWHHPTRGIVAPDEFIPLAEESGAILDLGRSVLFEACREAAGWHAPPGGELTLTVNVAAAQLGGDTFVADLVDILRATGLPPSRLVLEMTETALLHDTQTTIARLSAIRGLGVRVAIDDFGTGYSSLGYLRRFPVDLLKIAREFIPPPDAGDEGWAFADAIVALGRALGLRIVAEGIEAPGQHDRLVDMGCEFGQGFLYSEPVPGEAVEAVLAARARSPRSRAASLKLAGVAGAA